MNLQKDDGPHATIDFNPDFRFPLYSIESLVIKAYPLFNAKELPYCIPPSILGYCLALLYGLALLNDTAISRVRQSTFAQEFTADPLRNAVFIHLPLICAPIPTRNL